MRCSHESPKHQLGSTGENFGKTETRCTDPGMPSNWRNEEVHNESIQALGRFFAATLGRGVACI
jgi:hypothetical protein